MRRLKRLEPQGPGTSCRFETQNFKRHLSALHILMALTYSSGRLK